MRPFRGGESFAYASASAAAFFFLGSISVLGGGAAAQDTTDVTGPPIRACYGSWDLCGPAGTGCPNGKFNACCTSGVFHDAFTYREGAWACSPADCYPETTNAQVATLEGIWFAQDTGGNEEIQASGNYIPCHRETVSPGIIQDIPEIVDSLPASLGAFANMTQMQAYALAEWQIYRKLSLEKWRSGQGSISTFSTLNQQNDIAKENADQDLRERVIKMMKPSENMTEWFEQMEKVRPCSTNPGMGQFSSMEVISMLGATPGALDSDEEPEGSVSAPGESDSDSGIILMTMLQNSKNSQFDKGMTASQMACHNIKMIEALKPKEGAAHPHSPHSQSHSAKSHRNSDDSGNHGDGDGEFTTLEIVLIVVVSVVAVFAVCMFVSRWGRHRDTRRYEDIEREEMMRPQMRPQMRPSPYSRDTGRGDGF